MTLFPVPVQQVVMSYFLFCIAHGAEKLMKFWKLFSVQRRWVNKWILNCLITVSSKKKKKDSRMTSASKNFNYEEIILLLEERTAPGWWDKSRFIKNWKLKNTENCFKRAFLGLDDNTVLKEENKIVKTKKCWTVT